MRIAKYLAHCGIASRRKCEQLVLDGKVKINGTIVTNVATTIQPGKDKVEVAEVPVQRESKEYYLINKPKKTICSSNDEHGRNTVLDLIDSKARLFTVGRLDYDTTGVLIVTNDGDFANLLTHPRYKIPKVYDVIINNIIEIEDIKTLERGFKLFDGTKVGKAKVKIIHKDFATKQTRMYLTIYEGKNHQVKKMMETLGYRVNKLHRRLFGFVDVFDLRLGEYRLLKPFEVKKFKALAQEGKDIF